MEKLSKLLKKIDDNILTALLSIFIFLIPLYPKFPFKLVNYTYVAIRLEDFYVVLLAAVFMIQFLRRKVTFHHLFRKPIFVFWAIVFAAYVSGLFLTRTIEFPHLGLLHGLRRVEYMMIFFIAAAGVRTKRDFKILLYSLFASLFLVSIYGIGQRFLDFPAVSTMNPEFAKGHILLLTPEARLTSTFAGHYDLAAYLVFLMPLLWGLYFSAINIFDLKVRNKIMLFLAGLLPILLFRYAVQYGQFLILPQSVLIITSVTLAYLIYLIVSHRALQKVIVGFLIILLLIILVLTASRTSFIAYMISTPLFLLFLRKYKYAVFIIILSLVLTATHRELADRFLKTFQIKQILVNRLTGEAYVAQRISSKELPAGTAYIDLKRRAKDSAEAEALRRDLKLKADTGATIRLPGDEEATPSGEYETVTAVAADISFATRLQVEWPRALKAFIRNPLLGTGPSSITESTDNDYLRWLGEFGFLGFAAFMYILGSIALFIYKTSTRLLEDSRPLFLGGLFSVFGLMVNAGYIDVFEASKVAYVFWFVMGILVVGVSLYAKETKGAKKTT